MENKKLIYNLKWCCENEKNCLIYNFKRKDLICFIDGLQLNSVCIIKPILVDVSSNEYLESIKWYNIYTNDDNLNLQVN